MSQMCHTDLHTNLTMKTTIAATTATTMKTMAMATLVLCRLRLKALSWLNRAESSPGHHKPSLKPVTAHGSGFTSQKPEAAAQADGFGNR
jgi:hypothetical protein